MCYQVILSTDAPENLGQLNSGLLGFSRKLPYETGTGLLRHSHRWHVQSKSRCSCTFRHATDLGLGFGEPVAWYPEEDDALRATARFTGIVRKLVDSGYSVDCIDLWQGESGLLSEPVNLVVDLSVVGDSQFRFFENCLMQFTGD